MSGILNNTFNASNLTQVPVPVTVLPVPESSPLQLDIFLSILSPIAVIVFWVFAVYMLVHYQHPEDVTGYRVPKLIIVLSISLVFINVFMLPLDVASRQSRYGGLPMMYLWYTTYALMGLLGLFVIPFTIFWYEAEDPLKPKKKLGVRAAWKMAIIVALFIIASIVAYFFLGIVEVETQVITATLIPGDTVPSSQNCQGQLCGTYATVVVDWKVSYIIFLITILSFAGFCVFVVFGGIGLIALPHDLLYNFWIRPRPIDQKEYQANNVRIGERAEKLIKMGLNYTNSRSPDYNNRSKIMVWKKNVYVLDEDFTRNRVAYKLQGGPTILAYVGLVFGIFCVCMSIMWIIQIIIWTNISILSVTSTIGYPLLNFMLIVMDGVWEFFGVFFFAFFAAYLMLCVVVGNFKFGLRIPYLIELHVMTPASTLISSFLVNVELLLVASLAVTQFTARSFSVYVRVTSGNSIFNVGVSLLKGLKWVWFAFGWIIIGFAGITLIYFIFRPSDKGRHNARAILSEVDYC